MDIVQSVVGGAVGFVVARICWDTWQIRRQRMALREILDHLESGGDIPMTVVMQEETPDGPLTTVERTTLDGLCERMRWESVDDCE